MSQFFRKIVRYIFNGKIYSHGKLPEWFQIGYNIEPFLTSVKTKERGLPKCLINRQIKRRKVGNKMRFSLPRLAAMLTAGWLNPSRLAISVRHPFSACAHDFAYSSRSMLNFPCFSRAVNSGSPVRRGQFFNPCQRRGKRVCIRNGYPSSIKRRKKACFEKRRKVKIVFISIFVDIHAKSSCRAHGVQDFKGLTHPLQLIWPSRILQ